MAYIGNQPLLTSSYLNDLLDVNTSGKSDGMALVWDATAVQWVPQNISISSFTTDELTEGSTNLFFTEERVDDRVDALFVAGTGIQKTYDDNGNLLTIAIDFSEFDSDDIVEGAVNTFLASRDTDDIGEGTTNLYYTDARARAALSAAGDLTYNSTTGEFSVTTYKSTDFDTDFAAKDTGDLTEGSNLYYTDARVQTKLGSVSGHIVPTAHETYDLGSATNAWRDLYLSGFSLYLGGSVIKYNDQTGTVAFEDDQGNPVTVDAPTTNTTDDVSEGATSLYYTDARARAALSAAGDLSYNSTTGEFSVTTYKSTDFDTDLASKTTDDLTEGTNLYYTDARVGTYLTTNSYATETYADTAESNANAYTDARETAITSAYQTYAQAQADAAESDANTYTDNAVSGLASETYVDTAVANVVDTAPEALNTLNELAAALGDDANFATTVATDIGTKVSKAGDTMTGLLTLSGNPTTNLHAATKQYVDAAITAGAGDTDSIAEGSTNLYYTDARARAALSAAGDLSYNSTTGAFSFTERTDAEVRGLVSAGGDLTYNNTTGEFSYTTPTTIASLSNHDTDDLGEGAVNLYYTDARARQAISGSVGIGYDNTTGVISIGQAVNTNSIVTFDTVNADLLGNVTGNVTGTVSSIANHDTDDLSEGATNLYYTSSRATDDARAAVSGGTGVTYNSSTGEFAIGQAVGTGDTVTFSQVNANVLGNLTGDVTGTVSSLANHDTDDLAEGTNLYYTDARVESRIDAYVLGGVGVDVTAGAISIGQDVSTTSNVTFNDVTINGSLLSDDITAATMTASGNVIIQGNLTVNGTTTTVNSQNVEIGVSTITLNEAETGTPSSNAGIIVNRGTETDVSLLWDEANDQWTVDGNNFVAANFIGDLTGDVTGTVSDISNHNTGDLTEGSNLYYTDARVRAAISAAGDLAYNSGTGQFSVTTYKSTDFDTDLASKTTDDLTEGTNLYYTTARANTDFDTRLATKTTDNITEGSTRLYFTNERVDDRVGALIQGGTNVSATYDDNGGSLTIAVDSTGGLDLSNNTTTDVAEGTNLYYTDTRARAALSAAGDLAYNSTTGEFSVTTYKSADFATDLAASDTDDVSEGATNLYYTDARARGALSAGGDLSYNGTTGEFSYTTPTTIASLSNHDTDDLSEGATNLYYTDARAQGAISVTDAGGDGSLTYAAGVITYTGPSATETRAHFSGGTGVTITNGEVAIGQSVGTSDNVTFNDLIVSGDLTVNGTTTTVNAENLAISDNMIYLRDGETTGSVDLGWAGNYNDGTYAHTGLFRDASDGRFKVYDSYTPEPDAAPNIDTSHASFNLAPFQAGEFIGDLTGDVTGNVTGNLTGNVTGQVSDISNHDTGDLTEGSNLYYTDARVQTKLGSVSGHIVPSANEQYDLGSATNAWRDLYLSGFSLYLGGAVITYDDNAGSVSLSDGEGGALALDASLSNFTTADLAEGANLYYTDTRARAAISAGGDLSYNSTTGEVSFTERTDAEVRGLVSAAGDLSYNSTTGEFSVTTYKSTDFDSDFSGKTTTNLAEGTNLYFTNERVDDRVGALIQAGTNVTVDYNDSVGTLTISANAVGGYDLSNNDTDDLSEGSTNLYFTDARARSAVSVTDAGGDGSLAYNSTSGVITYTGPSAAETRAHFTGGTGVTITEGQVAIGQAVGTSDDVTFNNVTVGGSLNSDDITAATMTASGNVIVQGNLTVNGTTTTVNSNTVNIGDAIITLNSDETQAASQNAGIEIERGTDTNVSLIWDEAANKWTVGTQTMVAATFEGDLTGDVTGNVTGTVSDISNHDTDALAEGSSNLYYTDARVNANIAAKSTDDISEGTNLYYTDARADARIAAANIEDLANVDTTGASIGDCFFYGDGGVWTTQTPFGNSDFDTRLATKDTDDISEGATNLYYTTARVADYLVGNGYLTNITGESLGDLANVSVASPNDGQILSYDDGTSSWVAINNEHVDFDTEFAAKSTTDLSEGTNLYYTDARADARIAAADLTDLNGVLIDTPTSGQVLKYNGTNWVNAGDIDTGIGLTDLSVTTASASGNGSLSYNNTNGVFTFTPADVPSNVSDLFNDSEFQTYTQVSTAITTATTGLASETYVNNAVSGLATETYVDNAVSGLVDSAPAALDTLNELAAALGDDANFATTVTNSLATKLEDITGESVGDLTDVDITTAAPTDGQALVWDNANSKFVPGSVASGTGEVSETFTTTTANQVLDTFSTTAYQGGEYLMIGRSDAGTYMAKMLVMYDGSDVTTSTYSQIGTDIGSVDAQMNGTDVEIIFSPTSADATINFTKTLISNTDLEGYGQFWTGTSADLMTETGTVDAMTETGSRDMLT